MTPQARKCIDQYIVQSQFRELYPNKAKAIQGMTVPTPYCNSVEDMLVFADEKIKSKNTHKIIF
jgi:hypothetical protein